MRDDLIQQRRALIEARDNFRGILDEMRSLPRGSMARKELAKPKAAARATLRSAQDNFRRSRDTYRREQRRALEARRQRAATRRENANAQKASATLETKIQQRRLASRDELKQITTKTFAGADGASASIVNAMELTHAAKKSISEDPAPAPPTTTKYTLATIAPEIPVTPILATTVTTEIDTIEPAPPVKAPKLKSIMQWSMLASAFDASPPTLNFPFAAPPPPPPPPAAPPPPPPPPPLAPTPSPPNTLTKARLGEFCNERGFKHSSGIQVNATKATTITQRNADWSIRLYSKAEKYPCISWKVQVNIKPNILEFFGASANAAYADPEVIVKTPESIVISSPGATRPEAIAKKQNVFMFQMNFKVKSNAPPGDQFNVINVCALEMKSVNDLVIAKNARFWFADEKSYGGKLKIF